MPAEEENEQEMGQKGFGGFGVCGGGRGLGVSGDLLEERERDTLRVVEAHVHARLDRLAPHPCPPTTA